MDYPIKSLFIKDGVVVTFGITYTPDAVIGGPADTEEVKVPGDHPAVTGWRASFDDETQAWAFLPPLPSSGASTMGTGAGGGQQRPPDEK